MCAATLGDYALQAGGSPTRQLVGSAPYVFLRVVELLGVSSIAGHPVPAANKNPAEAGISGSFDDRSTTSGSADPACGRLVDRLDPASASAGRASDLARPAVDRPGPGSAFADPASDRGRPDSAGCPGLDCSLTTSLGFVFNKGQRGRTGYVPPAFSRTVQATSANANCRQ
jgi:hypothetical protein